MDQGPAALGDPEEFAATGVHRGSQRALSRDGSDLQGSWRVGIPSVRRRSTSSHEKPPRPAAISTSASARGDGGRRSRHPPRRRTAHLSGGEVSLARRDRPDHRRGRRQDGRDPAEARRATNARGGQAARPLPGHALARTAESARRHRQCDRRSGTVAGWYVGPCGRASRSARPGDADDPPAGRPARHRPHHPEQNPPPANDGAAGWSDRRSRARGAAGLSSPANEPWK